MKHDPDQILNRLVVTSLTIFVTVSLLLAALIAREIRLQQQLADLSLNLQASIEDLGDTTVEIQSELSELRTAIDAEQKAETLDEVAKLLTNVDQQLGTIEVGIAEVAAGLEGELESAPPSVVEEAVPLILEPEPGDPPVAASATPTDADSVPVVRDRADQTFTIFAILLGAASIVIALLLGLAVRVQERASYSEIRSADPT